MPTFFPGVTAVLNVASSILMLLFIFSPLVYLSPKSRIVFFCMFKKLM